MPPPTKEPEWFTSFVPLWGTAFLLACAFIFRALEKLAGA